MSHLIRSRISIAILAFSCSMGLSSVLSAQEDSESSSAPTDRSGEASDSVDETDDSSSEAPSTSDGERSSERDDETASDQTSESDTSVSYDPPAEPADRPDVDADQYIRRANAFVRQNNLDGAVTYYEQALRAAPETFPSAYYNFAEVLKAKEEWGRALLMYHAYRAAARTEPSRKEAREAIETLTSRLSEKLLGTLTVDITPETESKLYANGFLIARGEDLQEATLYADEYTIRASVKDHHPAVQTVTLERQGSQTIEMRPKIKTFHGKVQINVDQKEANIELKPEDLDSPEGPDEPIQRTSPVEEPIQLVTGRYLLEVTKEGYHRWVRYITIRRDKTTSVRVEMSEKLPEEIR